MVIFYLYIANDEQMELHVIDSTNSDPDSALKREAISKLENKIASLMIEDEVKDEGMAAHACCM